jgi:hypothetical protein
MVNELQYEFTLTFEKYFVYTKIIPKLTQNIPLPPFIIGPW